MSRNMTYILYLYFLTKRLKNDSNGAMNINLFGITDPILIFTIILFIVLVFPAIFNKIKLPGIVGLIVAGIIIGPNTFGILENGDAINLISKVGILYIMFLAGLEVDIFQIKKNIPSSITFGLLTFFIPLIMGTLVGLFVLKLSVASSILLAGMFSTHTLLSYSIVSKLGLVNNSGATAAIGGTIITDTLAMLVLAIITAPSNEKNDILFWIKFFLFLAIYTLAVISLVPLIGRWFFKTLAKNETVEYIFVLFIVLTCSCLAPLAGLEPIIGAFLAGLILNSLIPKKSALMNRIDFIGNSLFIPIFLISVGMLVDLKILFANPKTWLVSLTMIIVALTSKFLAAFFSGKILKWSKNEIGLVYGMSVNHVAATLAVVLIGYDFGFFDDSILAGTIIIITITCFIGPIITEYFGKKIVLSEDRPIEERNEQNLRILVPIYNKNHIKDLMELSFILSKNYSTESIYPINIVMDDFNVENKIMESEKLLAVAVAKSLAANISVTPITRVDISVGAGIMKAVRDLRISCVITGWDGREKSLGKVFGYNVDPIVENSVQLLIINKIVTSYAAAGRIVLIVPPFVEKQEGSKEIFNIISNFSVQFKTKVLIVAQEDTLNGVSSLIRHLSKKVEIDTLSINFWKNVDRFLENIVKKDDILALFSARITRPAWQPFLSKLPGILSKKFTTNNIMILYPSEEKWRSRELQTPVNSEFLFHFIENRNFYFNLNNLPIKNAFNYILKEKFGKTPEVLNELSDILSDIAINEPLTLLPGVILVHTHISQIEGHIIYVGVNRSGFDIPNIPEKINIMLVLLTSTEQPPEYHLNLLKEIVHLLKIENFVESVSKSNSFKEFEKTFKAGCKT
ncbi:MAG: Glutathione-regulated potassium-efflux system protein KefC [Spirochaetes bacterium ADurb.Bin133]|jgi:Kef-type K+ transport system membrane component KefB/mannitol/fructose-specific phosphotransferase system IIA component (Ntr-type)|nr:MAG: Glutathione-regulated potassium-efflux system protein KefC [Spirochaetes bacterium ADurb.Bin133]